MTTQLFSRALVLVYLCVFGAATSFYLLLPAVPLYAESGGASGAGIGLATGALMFATVVAELGTPRLVARFGYRMVFAAGLLLVGAPALVLPASDGMPAIVAVCVVRGLGFGLTVVVGSALVALLVPADRRGEGLGIAGVAAGVPTVAVLPLGVWLTGHVGYPPVFTGGAVVALAAMALTPGLPGRAAVPERGSGGGILAGLRTAGLQRPSVVFGVTAMAAGLVSTFLPLAITGEPGLAALALLVQASASTLGRWLTGRYGDRHGADGLLIPGLLAAAAGVAAMALTGEAVPVLAGAVVFGAGFGITHTASQALMYARVTAPEYGTVSAVWNLAFDTGLGAGAAGFGLLAALTGYPAAFAVTGGLMLAALAPAWRDRDHEDPKIADQDAEPADALTAR